MARPKDKNSRRSRAEKRRAEKAALTAAGLGSRSDPNARVAARRERFRFLGSGRIDQDIHDAIGQLHALGLLNGHGHEAKDLRDIGRDYADLYWEHWGPGDGCGSLAPSTGSFERHSKTSGNPPSRSKRDDRFDRLDDGLTGLERTVLKMLVTDHYYTDDLTGWAQRLIDRAHAARAGKPEPHTQAKGHDAHMLKCAIRGLCQLKDADLPPRFARLAA